MIKLFGVINKFCSLARVFAAHIVVIIFTIAMGGCANQGSGTWVDTVSISVDFDANDTSATAVDVIFAYRLDILEVLMAMPASDYFARAAQIKRDNPDLLDIIRYEVVPGQLIVEQPIRLRGSSPVGGVVFASYLVPGEHRVAIGTERDLQIHLMQAEFVVSDRSK